MNPHRAATFSFVLAAALLFAVACASTPATRIRENQALFDTYSTEAQANIRQGKVALGYDPDMVRMALGEPDERSTEISEAGETVIWGYVRTRPGYSVGIGGGSYWRGPWMSHRVVGIDTGSQRDYTAIISFREGQVITARHFER